jgi:hypothetical protein
VDSTQLTDADRHRLALLTLPAQKTWTPSTSSQDSDTLLPTLRQWRDAGYPPNQPGVQQRKTFGPYTLGCGETRRLPSSYVCKSWTRAIRQQNFSSKEPLTLFPKPLSWYASDHLIKRALA